MSSLAAGGAKSDASSTAHLISWMFTFRLSLTRLPRIAGPTNSLCASSLFLPERRVIDRGGQEGDEMDTLGYKGSHDVHFIISPALLRTKVQEQKQQTKFCQW